MATTIPKPRAIMLAWLKVVFKLSPVPEGALEADP